MNRIAWTIPAALAAGVVLALTSPKVSGAKPPNGCPAGLAGPALVYVAAGDKPFCIDATEVKQRGYAVFLAASKLKAPAQSPECSWNGRFDPIPADGDERRPVGSCGARIYDPATRGDYPMTCVDWCDAKAYCEWAGKRLCDGLGAQKETLASQTDAKVSEWQYACTEGGTSKYPYGDAYVAGKCIDAQVRPTAAIPGSPGSAACTGAEAPFDRITDLVGNVREWTSACDAQTPRLLRSRRILRRRKGVLRFEWIVIRTGNAC